MGAFCIHPCVCQAVVGACVELTCSRFHLLSTSSAFLHLSRSAASLWAWTATARSSDCIASYLGTRRTSWGRDSDEKKAGVRAGRDLRMLVCRWGEVGSRNHLRHHHRLHCRCLCAFLCNPFRASRRSLPPRALIRVSRHRGTFRALG